MEDGVKAVEMGTQDAQKSGDALKDILKQINMVTSEISQIAVASEQQTATANEIAQNIQHISGVMEETARNISENADAASQMAGLSAELKKLISQFRLATACRRAGDGRKGPRLCKSKRQGKGVGSIQQSEGRICQRRIIYFCPGFLRGHTCLWREYSNGRAEPL